MRELKKIKVTKISIVTSGANREEFMIRKSVDFEKEEVDASEFFPLMVPSHLIDEWVEEEELENLRKAEHEAEGADPDDPFPALTQLLEAQHAQIHPEQYEDEDEEDEDEDEEDE